MAHRRQRLSQLVHTLRHPDQWPHGIAQRRRLDQAPKLGDQLQIVLAYSLAPTTDAPNPPLCNRLRVEIILAPTNRRAGQPRHPCDNRKTAPTRSSNLRRREHPPPALVELATDCLPAISNGIFVDHQTDLRPF